ncbi:MAG: hypothetical protein EXR98_22270 [Gemmataceae bacterium]|nr:hypothetical protein [Gemmataceae bacterium]
MDSIIASLAKMLIAKDARQKGSEKPFFLHLAINAIHTPMQATAERLKEFEKIENPQRRTYAAMLTTMDQAIGNVLKKLEEIGELDNTLHHLHQRQRRKSDGGQCLSATGHYNGFDRDRPGRHFGRSQGHRRRRPVAVSRRQTWNTA